MLGTIFCNQKASLHKTVFFLNTEKIVIKEGPLYFKILYPLSWP